MATHLRRAGKWALATASAATAAAGIAAYTDEDARRSLTVSIFGTACRVFLRSTCSIKVHDEHHLLTGLQRHKGTALLTVCNHIATIDDPFLISALVPHSKLLNGGDEMRWGVCGHDVCFKEGSLLQRFADASKVLPIRRGGGIWQPELDEIISKLQAGHWVHYFPEGKVRQDGRVHPFRRGVGRLVAAVNDEERLTVVPFYHIGCDRVQPTTVTSTSVFSSPSFGEEIHVIFGPPVQLSHLLALRRQPPFDRKPELLYEVIAHTLEEEARAHTRIGGVGLTTS